MTPLPDTITLGIKFKHENFEGTQTFSGRIFGSDNGVVLAPSTDMRPTGRTEI